MKKHHIEFWDDEREIGNGVIVTLNYGYSFEPMNEHEGVRGFDTLAEARHATAKRRVFSCACVECLVNA